MKTFNDNFKIAIPKEAHPIAEQLDKDIQETIDAICKIKTKDSQVMHIVALHLSLFKITEKYNDLEKYSCKNNSEEKDFVEQMQKMLKFAHSLIDTVKEELKMSKTAYIISEYKQNKKKEQNDETTNGN